MARIAPCALLRALRFWRPFGAIRSADAGPVPAPLGDVGPWAERAADPARWATSRPCVPVAATAASVATLLASGRAGSAASAFDVSAKATWAYRSIVSVMVEWRASVWATLGVTPERARRVMNVCRSAWKSMTRPASSRTAMPAAARSAAMTWAISSGQARPDVLAARRGVEVARSASAMSGRSGCTSRRRRFEYDASTVTVGGSASRSNERVVSDLISPKRKPVEAASR
jgi:hypothetical protein